MLEEKGEMNGFLLPPFSHILKRKEDKRKPHYIFVVRSSEIEGKGDLNKGSIQSSPSGKKRTEEETFAKNVGTRTS